MADNQISHHRADRRRRYGRGLPRRRGVVRGFKKNIAIKRILPYLTKNKKFISMFLDEARLSLHLQHANIVGVFDIGHADDTYFIVMEFVDGATSRRSSSRRRQDSRLSRSRTALYIIMEVCKGLAYAHEVTDPETGRALGIVHRDISPPNILISKRGEVKLVDFGLAKATTQLEIDRPGRGEGQVQLPVARGGAGKEVDRARRHLRGRHPPLRAADRQAALLRRDRLPDGRAGAQAKVPPIAPQNPRSSPSSRRSSARRSRAPDERFRPRPTCRTRSRSTSSRAA